MVSSTKSFLQYFRTYPLRGVLTLLTIAIGVGSLIITFSLSFDVGDALSESLSQEGHRVVIANATLADDGTYTRQFPPAFDADTVSVLTTDYESLADATVVSAVNWDRISTGEESFQVRSVVAAGSAYADLMNLDFVAGSFFTTEDVADRSQVIAISESSATILFGGAEEAVGNDILVAVPSVSFGGDGPRRRMSQEPFTVVGVFTDVSELTREA